MNVTIQVSHADLGRYLPAGKTGAVRVDLTSKGRVVRWVTLRRNGLIELSGVAGSKSAPWRQTFRHHAPIDD